MVLDLGKGRVGAVSYNSSAPPSSRLSEIPFAISAATDGNNGGGLAGVLSQLQGARVVVSTANRTVAGSILTVEARHSQIDATKPPVWRSEERKMFERIQPMGAEDRSLDRLRQLVRQPRKPAPPPTPQTARPMPAVAARSELRLQAPL